MDYPKNEHELLKVILTYTDKYHWLIKSPFMDGDPWFAGLTLKGVTGWNGVPDYYGSGLTLTEAVMCAVSLIMDGKNEIRT